MVVRKNMCVRKIVCLIGKLRCAEARKEIYPLRESLEEDSARMKVALSHKPPPCPFRSGGRLAQSREPPLPAEDKSCPPLAEVVEDRRWMYFTFLILNSQFLICFASHLNTSTLKHLHTFAPSHLHTSATHTPPVYIFHS